MASYEYKEWQATPPWNQETPLQSLNNLRGLLHNPPDALQSELPDSFPYVQGLMEEVIEGIMEEAQVMSRTLGAVYAEYRLHYGDSREYVRIWKCVDVQPYQRKDYSNSPATQPGEYYEWQKMKNVDIHIRRTWRAQNEWQMLTKNQEEQQLLTANDPPKQPINVTSIVQNAIESSSSDEKQSSVGRIVALSKTTLMQTFNNIRPRSRSPRGSSAAAGSMAQVSDSALPIIPDQSTLSRPESADAAM